MRTSSLSTTATPVTASATALYFAYGSNLLSSRLLARTPSARFVAVARLPGFELRWHKAASDGSGKCDIVPAAGRPSADLGGEGAQASQGVLGVLWRIAWAEKPALDAAETLGIGYDEATVQVQAVQAHTIQAGQASPVQVNPGPASPEQTWHTAWTYRAIKIDPMAAPYDWYQALVVHGALEHGLEDAYVQALRAVQHKPDTDALRAARHFALLK